MGLKVSSKWCGGMFSHQSTSRDCVESRAGELFASIMEAKKVNPVDEKSDATLRDTHHSLNSQIIKEAILGSGCYADEMVAIERNGGAWSFKFLSGPLDGVVVHISGPKTGGLSVDLLSPNISTHMMLLNCKSRLLDSIMASGLVTSLEVRYVL